MCKPTSGTPVSDETTSNVSFDATPPGTLNWSANAGWDANGTFGQWKIMRLDVPNDDYSQMKAEVAVKISSVNHDDKGLENHLRKDDYLDAKGFPIAKINIDGSTFDKATNRYSCNAEVSLKGATQTVPLTFAVSDASPAVIKGNGTLFRKEFKVGDDSGVKNEVGISFEFEVGK